MALVEEDIRQKSEGDDDGRDYEAWELVYLDEIEQKHQIDRVRLASSPADVQASVSSSYPSESTPKLKSSSPPLQIPLPGGLTLETKTRPPRRATLHPPVPGATLPIIPRDCTDEERESMMWPEGPAFTMEGDRKIVYGKPKWIPPAWPETELWEYRQLPRTRIPTITVRIHVIPETTESALLLSAVSVTLRVSVGSEPLMGILHVDGLYYFECPWCNATLQIPEGEIHCRIFRHGMSLEPGTEVGPHHPEAECRRLARGDINGKSLLTGCGNPYYFDGTEIKLCGWR